MTYRFVQFLLPAEMGTLSFLIGRASLALIGLFAHSIITTYFIPDVAARAIFGLTGLKDQLATVHLDFTWGGLLRVVLMVMFMNFKLGNIMRLSSRIASLELRTNHEKLAKKAAEKNLPFGNDAGVLYDLLYDEDFAKEREEIRDIIKELIRKGILNTKNRPALKTILENDPGILTHRTDSWIKGQLYPVGKDLMAVLVTLIAPVLLPFALLRLAAQLNNKEPFPYGSKSNLLADVGVEFWSSVWHMWIISAEIFAITQAGASFDHDGNIFGKYVKAAVDATEKPYDPSTDGNKPISAMSAMNQFFNDVMPQHTVDYMVNNFFDKQ